jgi:hypothetical protein
VRRRVFFAGDGDGDAVSVTADFAGLGAGVGSAAKTLASAIKPMAAARSRMCFIIIYIWFVVQVKFLFFAEAWPTKALLRALDQLQHARQIACRFQPHLDKPKTEACSDFFYASVLISFTLHTHLALMNTSKHVKFRKKFAHSISTHRKLHKELARKNHAL